MEDENLDSVELSKYIVCKMKERGEEINHLKLQKLLYYVQAWHVTFTDKPIIKEEFEAWLHGPVVRKVWDYYKKYSVMIKPLKCEKYNLNLTKEQEEIIEDVLNEYGDKTGYYLECLTHEEKPWREARKRGENSIISCESMKEYYSGLLDVR
jgi:uncharacterized phage-associated protein